MGKYLITGSGGLIGREVVSLLAGREDLYPLSHNLNWQTLPGSPIYCDMEQVWGTESFPQKIDTVIHLAQSEHFRDFPNLAQKIFDVNTGSTIRLLEYARKAGAKTFVLASSGGIYGSGDKGFREDEPILAKNDLGFYLGTKLACEILAENYTPYMNIIILRFFFVYGARQKPNMLIPRLINSVRNGIPIILQGKEGIHINPTHVMDAAKAICKSAELNGSHKINIAGPDVLSLREIGDEIGRQVNVEPIFQIQGGTPHNLIGDITKMNYLLGKPTINFREGVQRFLRGE